MAATLDIRVEEVPNRFRDGATSRNYFFRPNEIAFSEATVPGIGGSPYAQFRIETATHRLSVFLPIADARTLRDQLDAILGDAPTSTEEK